MLYFLVLFPAARAAGLICEKDPCRDSVPPFTCASHAPQTTEAFPRGSSEGARLQLCSV